MHRDEVESSAWEALQVWRERRTVHAIYCAKAWRSGYFLALMFKVGTATFERTVMTMLNTICDYVYARFVKRKLQKYDLQTLNDSGKVFCHFTEARYSTDVTFQQANRPIGNMQEARSYFSGKHKLHGYIREAAVLPNGIAVHATAHHPGAASDLQIFRDHIVKHREILRKHGEEHSLDDTYKMHNKYPNI